MPERNNRSLLPNDLFSLKFIHDAQLSPDGNAIAYVVSNTREQSGEELYELVIMDLTTQKQQQVQFQGRATYPRWSPDGKHLAFIGSTASSNRVYVADTKRYEIAASTPEEAQLQGPLSWSPDNATIAFTAVANQKTTGVRRITERVFKAESIGEIDHLALSLHLFDVRSGTTRRLNLGSLSGFQPAFSPCGQRILFLGSDTVLGYSQLSGGLKLYTLELQNDRVVEVLGAPWFIATAAWSPCGERIVVAGDYDSPLIMPFTRLWVIERDGSGPVCRTEGFTNHIGFPVHHDMPTWATSQSNRLVVGSKTDAYVTVVNHGCAEIYRVALQGPIRCDPVATGTRSCLIMDANARKSQLLYCASDLQTPWDLYGLDLETQRERRLTRLNEAAMAQWPQLKSAHLHFTSQDGQPIEAWYLARQDRDGPQPTVMFIHGGPMLCVGHVFRFDFHLLAANGYAVLFANFRGSAGYGEPFLKAITGDWGSRGFPDHMGAVDAAIAHGWADAGRLGVWGPSHGGFATAWIVGHTNRFRAAVAESSVTNFSTLYYLTDAPDIFIRDLGGRPDEVPDVYRARSPLTYASRCQTPTLMLHGEEDLRCPLAEAEQFYRALHDAGCKTELVRIPGMTHMGDSMGPLSARLAQNEALLEWFERHL